MERNGTFYDFMQRYPLAEGRQLELSDSRVCDIRLGMFHDIVEEVFVGVYLNSGKCCMEQALQEQDMKDALRVIRVLPDAAIQLALDHAKRFLK